MRSILSRNMLLKVAVAAHLFAILSSCSVASKSTGMLPAEMRQRQAIVNNAKDFLGTRYQYGGTSNKGMDCSGLVFQAFRAAQLQIPRISAEQYRRGASIELRQSRVGDLIFFAQGGKVNHVAIVSRVTPGSVWVIHSTTSQGVISEDILDSVYWSKRIKGVRDVVSSR